MTIRYFRAKTLGLELIRSEAARRFYPLHSHVSSFVLGLVLGGSLTLTQEHGSRRYHRDQSFSIPPYAPHSLTTDSACALLCLCVDKTQPIDEDRLAALLRILPRACAPTFRQIELLAARWTRVKALDKSFAPDVALLVQRLESCPERKCSLAEMARAVFLSHCHLLRKFKREVGLTPHQFQVQNRVRKARRLLSESRTIAEAALAAGFCDQSHFIRQFERRVGLTPTAYRQACRCFE